MGWSPVPSAAVVTTRMNGGAAAAVLPRVRDVDEPGRRAVRDRRVRVHEVRAVRRELVRVPGDSAVERERVVEAGRRVARVLRSGRVPADLDGVDLVPRAPDDVGRPAADVRSVEAREESAIDPGRRPAGRGDRPGRVAGLRFERPRAPVGVERDGPHVRPACRIDGDRGADLRIRGLAERLDRRRGLGRVGERHADDRERAGGQEEQNERSSSHALSVSRREPRRTAVAGRVVLTRLPSASE